MILEMGDYISCYCGDCSPRRDKSKDKHSIRFYQVVDIIPEPSGGKPSLYLQPIPKDEVDRTKKHYYVSDVYKYYNIVHHSDG